MLRFLTCLSISLGGFPKRELLSQRIWIIERHLVHFAQRFPRSQGSTVEEGLSSTFTTMLGKDWCWSWSSNPLASWCEEPTHWKRPWFWERLRAGREGDDRGWDGWMASPTQWTWVWASSRSWWWTGKLGMLQSMGSQRVGHDLATEQQELLCNTGNTTQMTYTGKTLKE